MVKNAKMILSILDKNGYEAYFVGGKCRDEIHNSLSNTHKVKIKNVNIITNATVDQIKKIFPQGNDNKKDIGVISIRFGEFIYEIATYRNNNYGFKNINTNFVNNVYDDILNRDFTINAILQNNTQYKDYIYKKISGIEDIRDGIIRAIGNPVECFENDPIRIFRAFRIMSELNYTIEKNTLNGIKKTLNLISNLEIDDINKELNKIISGINVNNTIKLMKEIGLFDIPINNYKYLEHFSDIKNVELLDKYNIKNEDLICSWTILLKDLPINVVKDILLILNPMPMINCEKVIWLIENINIIYNNNIKDILFKCSREGIIKENKLMCMKDLIKKLINIHLIMNPENKKLCDKLEICFFGRPYFYEQLKVTDEQLIDILGEKSESELNDIKDKILYKLIMTEKFPVQTNDYDSIVSKCIGGEYNSERYENTFKQDT